MHICQRNSNQPLQNITTTLKSDMATKVKFNSNITILLHSTAHLYFIMCGGIDFPWHKCLQYRNHYFWVCEIWQGYTLHPTQDFKNLSPYSSACHTLRSGFNHREVTCKTWSCLRCNDCHKNCTHELSPDWANSLEAALEHPGYKIFLILADFRLSTRFHERRGDPR